MTNEMALESRKTVRNLLMKMKMKGDFHLNRLIREINAILDSLFLMICEWKNPKFLRILWKKFRVVTGKLHENVQLIARKNANFSANKLIVNRPDKRCKY